MVIGIAFLIIGIIVIALRKSSINTAAATIAGVIAIALGVLFILGGLGRLNRFGKVLMIWLLAGSVGIMALYSGCRHLYIKIFCCRRKMMGTFLDIKRHSAIHQYRHSYTLEFQYRVDGRQYQKESEETYYNRDRLEKYYKNGQEYPIFISVKNPKIFVVKRRIFFAEVMVLFTGILFIGTAVWLTIFMK